MTWVGTGVLWTISGGVPHSLGLIDEAAAQEARGLTFLQISDSHVGFDKPANPNALGTLEEAIAKVNALPTEAGLHDPYRRHQPPVDGSAVRRRRPHHLADRASTCITCPASMTFSIRSRSSTSSATDKAPRAPAGTASTPTACTSSASSTSLDLKAGGLGNLGADQLEWLEADLKGRSASTPDRRVRPHPALDRLSGLGLGHRRRRTGALISQALRLGDGAQRPHPPSDAEGRRQRHLPHRALDRVSAAGAGHRAFARTDESPRRQAAQHARHRQCHVQAKRAAARDHRHAA